MRLRSLLSSFVVAALAACSPLGVCTLIGCENGLVVRFNREPAGPFRIEAVVPGDPTQYVIECPENCFPLFAGLVAEQVTVRVTVGGTTYSQDFRPRYETQYPNGRDCGPACRQAQVTFQLPS